MKVLLLIESLRAGGKERRLVELIKGLVKIEGIEIHLVVMKREIHYQEVKELNIPVYIIERKVLKKDPVVFFRLFKLVREIRPDIIHVWGHMVAVYSVPVKILLRIPLINNELTDAMRKYKLGKYTVFYASDRIIANTHAGLKAYSAPMHKSSVIHNGFNFDRIKSIEAKDVIRERFGISTHYVVGMVATFYKYKDYDTYIKAALRILKKRDDITFLCVGDGDDSPYKKLVPASLKDKILFLGKQSRVESIMNVCDIGVLTTNVKFHGEGISNALMEFMALGKPVIATNFGGSPELIEDTISGFLIDAYADNQLVQKIFRLIESNDERERIGQNAVTRIRKHFSIESMVKSFHEEYLHFSQKKITT